MSDFESKVPILVQGWKRLVLHHDGATTIIPNDIMLKELSCPPLPHEILTLLSIYETSETLKETIKGAVEKILNNKQQQPSWKLLLKAVEATSSERLYTVVSQNAYRLEPSNNLESHIESQKVLQDFSNVVLESISGLFDCKSASDLQIENLLATNGHSIETYRFIQLVQRYCTSILPRPYQTRFNRKSVSHIINVDSTKKQIELTNRLKERFSLYRYCSKLDELYTRQVNSNEKTARKFNSLLDGKIIDLGATSRSIARKQQKERKIRPDRLPVPLIGSLHQCVFCALFSFPPLPPQAGNFKQHCGRDECIDAYDAWFEHINGKGIRLRRGKVPD
jgi:hypothetical protein